MQFFFFPAAMEMTQSPLDAADRLDGVVVGGMVADVMVSLLSAWEVGRLADLTRW